MKKFIRKIGTQLFNLITLKTNNGIVKFLSVLLWVQILIWLLKIILLFVK